MKLTSITVRKILQYPIAHACLPPYIKRHFPRLFKQIVSQTEFLNKFCNKRTVTLLERLYCIEFDLHDMPLCQKCKEKYVRNFRIQKYEYSKWCCTTCQASDDECIKKSKNTRKTKYGNENFNNCEKSKSTIAKKCQDDPQYWKKRVKKTKETKKQRYGNENYQNSEKIKQTFAERLAENPNFWIDREMKSQKTKMQRHNDPTWNNREKYHQTCLDHFGVDAYTKSKEWRMSIKNTIDNDPTFYQRRNEKSQQTINAIPNFYQRRNEKTKKTCLERYGVESWLQTQDCRTKMHESIVRQKIEKLLKCEYDQPQFSYDFLLAHNLDKQFRYKFKCSKCGKTFTTRIGLVHCKHYHCPKCFPKHRSKCERTILEFVKSIYHDSRDIYYHDRKQISPLELDIFINCIQHPIAIEYNGIYWHSIDRDCKSDINKEYHYNKSILCEEKNINLISIFEDEWLFNPMQVKDKISKALGICNHVSMNDCNVVIDDSKMEIVYNGECIATLSFCKSRFNIHEEWEFKSYQTKQGIVVDNGLEILTQKFENAYKPSSIVSFIDRSYSNEQDFLNAGFVRDSICKPRLWWYNKLNLIEKYCNAQFKQEIAPTVLNESFIGSNDQLKALKDANWLRVYDCGQNKVVKYR